MATAKYDILSGANYDKILFDIKLINRVNKALKGW